MKHLARTASQALLITLTTTTPIAIADSFLVEDLFQAHESLQSLRTEQAPHSFVGRHRQAVLNLDLLDAERLRLNLFDDTSFVAVREQISDLANGHSVWIGHIAGKRNSSEVILALSGDALMGTARVDEQVFQIRKARGEGHIIEEIDPSMTLDEEPYLTPDMEGATPPPVPMESLFDEPPSSAETAPTTVDLMVVYTPRARNNSGGRDGVTAKIINAVTAANQAYRRSSVAMQLNLVHIGEVGYTESGDMSQTLQHLKNPSDGKMDSIHALRNQYGADQVAMLSADNNYCGIAYTMSPDWMSNAFAPYAFSVVHDDSSFACLTNHVLAHELGHNQGSDHNIEDSSSGGAHSYSHGFRTCGDGSFRTIMSYYCSGATRIGHFSNPSVSYDGSATGIDKAADNARSLNATRHLVAGWRATATGSNGGSEWLDNSAPTVTIVSPTDAELVNRTVRVEIRASDNRALSSIELLLDGEPIASTQDSTLIYDWQTFWYQGLHQLKAIATDSSGNQSQTSVIVEIEKPWFWRWDWNR